MVLRFYTKLNNGDFALVAQVGDIILYSDWSRVFVADKPKTWVSTMGWHLTEYR